MKKFLAALCSATFLAVFAFTVEAAPAPSDDGTALVQVGTKATKAKAKKHPRKHAKKAKRARRAA